jgi:hypothetical protein
LLSSTNRNHKLIPQPSSLLPLAKMLEGYTKLFLMNCFELKAVMCLYNKI